MKGPIDGYAGELGKRTGSWTFDRIATPQNRRTIFDEFLAMLSDLFSAFDSICRPIVLSYVVNVHDDGTNPADAIRGKGIEQSISGSIENETGISFHEIAREIRSIDTSEGERKAIYKISFDQVAVKMAIGEEIYWVDRNATDIYRRMIKDDANIERTKPATLDPLTMRASSWQLWNDGERVPGYRIKIETRCDAWFGDTPQDVANRDRLHSLLTGICDAIDPRIVHVGSDYAHFDEYDIMAYDLVGICEGNVEVNRVFD